MNIGDDQRELDVWPTGNANYARLTILTVFGITLAAFFALSGAVLPESSVAASLCSAALILMTAGLIVANLRRYQGRGRTNSAVRPPVAYAAWRGSALLSRALMPAAISLLGLGVIRIGLDVQSNPSGFSQARGGFAFFYAAGTAVLATALWQAIRPIPSIKQWDSIQVTETELRITFGRKQSVVPWRQVNQLNFLPTSPNEVRPFARITLVLRDGGRITLPLARAQTDPNVIWQTLNSCLQKQPRYTNRER